MSKPTYRQKFRTAWLKYPLFKDWLVAIESTVGQQAKCSICNVVVISRVASLKQYLESKKHKDNAKVVFGKVQTKLPFRCDIMGVKKAECQLALYVAGHTSINAINHLSETCKDCFKGCESAEKLQLHRTKCGQIIKNILATHFNEDLVQDIGDSPFGLLIDESTDISVTKFLGLIIIYYSTKQSKILTSFLSMPELATCTAEDIVATIKTVFQNKKLLLKKLMGIGTDNASVMVEVNNSVFK
jgi:hypothetical protein